MRISIGGAESAGFFREVSGFDSEREVIEAAATGSASATANSGSARPASVGLAISGEATDQRHTSWLEVLSRDSMPSSRSQTKSGR
jgi:hypothetical protein